MVCFFGGGRRTCAMVKYSIGMDRAFVPRVMKMAAFVDPPLTKAMKSGPPSLQSRSMRRIRALRTVPCVNVQLACDTYNET